jgi:hypothetical protein
MNAKKFAQYANDNPHIVDRFFSEANKLWEMGRRNWPAAGIVYFIRHQTALAENGDGWKVNQNISAHLARRYMKANPERPLFRLRTDERTVHNSDNAE